jgi:hypothetical protein
VEEVLGMIKGNELRIGNKVDYYGNIVTINYINDTDVGFSDYVPFDYPLLDDLNPIPITDQWLVSFGFEKIDNPNHTPNWIWVKNGNVWVYQKFKDGSFKLVAYKLTTTPSVHQLQNLYFALTGEELKYG